MNMASNSRDALVWRGAIAVPRAQLLREAAGLAGGERLPAIAIRGRRDPVELFRLA